MHQYCDLPSDGRRRQLLLAGVSAICLCSCVTPPEPPPIEIKADGIKDVAGLIAAMKSAAGSRLPAKASDESFFRAFALAFVEHAREAADKYNIPVPQWVLDRLPERKVMLPVIAAVPALGMVAFELLGISFVIPIGTIFVAVLGSLALMTVFIVWALSSDNPKSKMT